MRGYKLWSFDVTQAYLQSTVDLSRPVYICPSRELAEPDVYLLRLCKALYGLSDSGDYWNETLPRTLKAAIGLMPSTGDHVLYHHGNDASCTMHGIFVTRVDDGLGMGSSEFHTRSLQLEASFNSKPRESPAVTFVEVQISPLPHLPYVLHQPTYARQLSRLLADATLGTFRSLWYQFTWPRQTRPDLVAIAGITFQVTNASFAHAHIKLLNDTVHRARLSQEQGLTMHPLHDSTLCIIVLADAPFANKADFCTQLGYVFFLCNDTQSENFLYYTSYKSTRVLRSMLRCTVCFGGRIRLSIPTPIRRCSSF